MLLLLCACVCFARFGSSTSSAVLALFSFYCFFLVVEVSAANWHIPEPKIANLLYAKGASNPLFFAMFDNY